MILLCILGIRRYNYKHLASLYDDNTIKSVYVQMIINASETLETFFLDKKLVAVILQQLMSNVLKTMTYISRSMHTSCLIFRKLDTLSKPSRV